jgi:hypothetical protein
MVWPPPDGTAPRPPRPRGWAAACLASDGEDGACAHLPAPADERSAPGARIDQYLLRDLEITRPNHVWCADITYIPMRRDFLYLVAVLDWASRTVLAWRLSNTMDAEFCVEALKEALARFGKPGIFNTDQGSQFTSAGFTGVLRDAEVRISMDDAAAEIQVRLSERLRDRLRTADRARPVDQLLQRATASVPPLRPNAGRGVWAGRRNAISGARLGYGTHQNGGVN